DRDLAGVAEKRRSSLVLRKSYCRGGPPWPPVLEKEALLQEDGQPRRAAPTITTLLVCVALFAACKQPAPVAPVANQSSDQSAAASPSPSPTPPRPSGPIEFTDIPAQAGIHFKHNSGAFGKKYLPETIGSGAAFFDYDNDGWQDILLVNSMDWPENKKRKSFPALYKNNKDGTFTDVTQQAVLCDEQSCIRVSIAD